MRFARLQAEALAWPLANPDSFARATTALDAQALLPSFRDRVARYGPTSQADDHAHALWNSLDQHPLWFWLRSQGSKRLRQDGPVMRLVTDEKRPGIEILCWRFLSLRLPVSVLIAAATALDAFPPDRVRVLDPGLQPAGPMAHLHVHIGAAIDPETAWAELPGALADQHSIPVSSPLPGDSDSKLWLAILWRALLARRVLEAHLGHSQQLEHCSCAVVPHPNGCERELWERQAVAELCGAELTTGWLEVEAAIRLDLRHRDTGKDRWDPDRERRMLHGVFCHLANRDPGEGDPYFEKLFIQYLRVRTLLHQHLVMDPTRMGLPSFSEFFERTRVYTPRVALKKALDALAKEPVKPAAVELRSSPWVQVRDLQEIMRAIWDLNQKGVEAGHVFHFIRSRSASCPDPRSCPWPRQRWEAVGQATRLAQVMRNTSLVAEGLLHALRGLDLAGRELDGPLWLFIAPLTEVRRVAREVAGRQADGQAPGLQLTLHVGEDFRHLASGLRAIHEPYEWGLLERGDRLGHALALGRDARLWCEQNTRVLVTRWERLQDLAWMRSSIERFEIEATARDLLRIEREIDRHAESLWGRPAPTPDEVCAVRALMGRAETWEQLESAAVAVEPRGDLGEFSAESSVPRRKPLDLLVELVVQPDIWVRAEERVEISPRMEEPLLKQLQDALTELIAHWQTAIEVNPTSNLLIGDLESPLDQPMFHLRPVDRNDKRALPVCISADDPLTFATTLTDELAYAWAGMVVIGGVPPSYARQWLDEAAAASWRARFTLPPRTDSQCSS